MKNKCDMKVNGWIFLVFAAMLSAACSKSDSDTEFPSSAAETAFRAKYPTASAVEWERAGVFYKVEFVMEARDYDAWYTVSGKWLQTEYSVNYASLPAVIKKYAAGSINYPSSEWIPDLSAEVVERLNYPLWYGVELEKGKEEVTLWTDAQIHNHFDAVEDFDRDQLPQSVRGFLASNEADGWVTEGLKLADGSYVVNLLSGNAVKQVYFSRTQEWTYTAWPVVTGDLPEAVRVALQGNAYAGYTIRGAEYRQYAGKAYYHVVLESTENPGGPTLLVNIDASGNLVLAN